MNDKHEETRTMTIEEASMLMGVSKQFVRVGLQKGILPFGYAVQISSNRFTYLISRQKFYEHTGIAHAN
jgi:hypothetical protein